MASETPPPEPGAPAGPQKHVSGMLLASLFLSLAGFVLVPIIGPVIGGFLAVFGKKRVDRNPLLIGPRFGTTCLVLAGFALLAQGFMLYLNLPGMFMQQAVGEKVGGVMQALRVRDYEAMHENMSVAWREENSVEDVEAMVAAALPGEGEIVLSEDELKVREDEIGEEEVKRFKEWLDDEIPSELRFFLPYRLTPAKGPPVDIDFRVFMRRTGRHRFEAELTSLGIQRVGEPADVESGTDEAGSEDPGAGEDPAANEAEGEPEEEPR